MTTAFIPYSALPKTISALGTWSPESDHELLPLVGSLLGGWVLVLHPRSSVPSSRGQGWAERVCSQVHPVPIARNYPTCYNFINHNHIGFVFLFKQCLSPLGCSTSCVQRFTSSNYIFPINHLLPFCLRAHTPTLTYTHIQPRSHTRSHVCTHTFKWLIYKEIFLYFKIYSKGFVRLCR